MSRKHVIGVGAIAFGVFLSFSTALQAQTASPIGCIKNLCLGMTLTQAMRLPGGNNAFSGSSLACTPDGLIYACSIDSGTLAEVPAKLLLELVSNTTPPPIRKVTIPPPFDPTPSERRMNDPPELARMAVERNKQRAAAIAERKRAAEDAVSVFRLAYIFVTTDSNLYAGFYRALIQTYGKPNSQRIEIMQNALNAKYSSTISEWKDQRATMSLSERCETIDKTCLTLSDLTLSDVINRAHEALDKRRQRDL